VAVLQLLSLATGNWFFEEGYIDPLLPISVNATLQDSSSRKYQANSIIILVLLKLSVYALSVLALLVARRASKGGIMISNATTAAEQARLLMLGYYALITKLNINIICYTLID
jgi:hypothetical protein